MYRDSQCILHCSPTVGGPFHWKVPGNLHFLLLRLFSCVPLSLKLHSFLPFCVHASQICVSDCVLFFLVVFFFFLIDPSHLPNRMRLPHFGVYTHVHTYHTRACTHVHSHLYLVLVRTTRYKWACITSYRTIISPLTEVGLNSQNPSLPYYTVWIWDSSFSQLQ